MLGHFDALPESAGKIRRLLARLSPEAAAGVAGANADRIYFAAEAD